MKFQYPHGMCSSLWEFHRKPLKSFMKKKEKKFKILICRFLSNNLKFFFASTTLVRSLFSDHI